MENKEETLSEAIAETSSSENTTTEAGTESAMEENTTESITEEVSGNEVSANEVPRNELSGNEVSANEISTEEILSTEAATEITTEMTTEAAQPENKDGSHISWMIVGILIAVLLIGLVLTVLELRARKLRKAKRRHRQAMDYLERTMCPTTSDDVQNFEVQTVENAPFHIAKVHSVGKRSGQQDSFGVSELDSMERIQDKGMLAVVADGMGGLENGDEVSAIATVAMLRYFDEKNLQDNLSQELRNMVYGANDDVNSYLGKEMLGRCGTTMTAVMIKENKLYWISVGDSGIYLYRNNQLVELNKKHNYAAVLDEKVLHGEISAQEAASDPQRAALTSYIGAGELSLIDQNETAFELQSGDRVLLMSDGVFGTLSDEEISYLMHFNVNETAYKMQAMIEEKDKRNQDNYTALIIEYVG